MTAIVPTPPPSDGLLPVLDPADIPNLDDLITDDGAAVDNLFVEKQYRLLTDPLYTSWTPPGEDHHFLVATDVGWFYKVGEPPLAPDCFLSLRVRAGADLRAKENRSYFQWLVGKPPDVVIEIVSDKRGGEESYKKDAYADLLVLFYVVFDPDNRLGGGVLRSYVLNRRKYDPIDPTWFPEVGLGLTLWEGVFEGCRESWLRWCDQQGRVFPTGAERAIEANRDIERLKAQLRALGVEPEV